MVRYLFDVGELSVKLNDSLFLVAVEFAALAFLDVQLASLEVSVVRVAEHQFVVRFHLAAKNTMILVNLVIHHLYLLPDAKSLRAFLMLFEFFFVLPHDV